ncbi:MAG: micrococcal nuclease [Acidobacteria bacterium]|nr:MAG: micrococcal nuclease [Acidobacteriota bacterium]
MGMGLRGTGVTARTLAAIGCGMALSLSAWTQGNPDFAGTVTGVIDGDTIKVQLSSGPITVRLAHIDAPESYQPGGGSATRALHSRLLTQDVSLQVIEQEGEERALAVVLLEGENINAWMVKQGHAWAYRGFTQDANYCAWEDAARSLRRGLWSDPDWIAPWDWRMARKDPLFFATDHSNASTASCMRELREAPALDD